MAEKINASYILFQNDSLTKAYGSGKLLGQVELMKKNNIDIALTSVPFYTDLGKYSLLYNLVQNYSSYQDNFLFVSPGGYMKTSSLTAKIATICYLPPRKHIPDWAKLVKVFPQDTWTAIAISIPILIIVWWIFFKKNNSNNLNDLSKSLFTTLELYLTASIRLKPKFHHMRVLLVFFLIYHYLILCVYNASLNSNLTSPPLEPEIDTLDELIRRGVEIHAGTRISKTIKWLRGEEVWNRMKGSVVVDDDYFDMFLKYLNEPKYAVSVVEVTKFYIDNFRDVKIMKEKVSRCICFS